jgi:hypothetical protein
VTAGAVIPAVSGIFPQVVFSDFRIRCVVEEYEVLYLVQLESRLGGH